MFQTTLDFEIYSKIRRLSKKQKSEVLHYIDTVPRERHSTRLKRKKAMKQINEALKNLD